MFASLTANGQWVQGGNGIQASNMVLHLSAFENIIFAGTKNFIHNEEFLYCSTNNGNNWVDLQFYNEAICFTKFGNNFLTGTRYYGIYISASNGFYWYQSSLNNKTIYALTSLNNNIYAGTIDSGVFISSNNGVSWDITSLNNKFIYSLLTHDNSILAGTYGYGIYISTDYGTSWVQSSLNNKSVNCLASNGNDIFASITDSGGVYRSTDNGISWTRTSLFNKFIRSIAVYGNNIFAAADNIGGTGGIYFSSNNGDNWSLKNEGFNNIPSQFYSLTIANNLVLTGVSLNNSLWQRPLSEIVNVQNMGLEIPSSYSLEQNYPNPFNPKTVISFQLPVDSKVLIKIYDVQGREVETLVNEMLQAGTYSTQWNASAYPSGVYFYRMQADGYTVTKRMTLIK